MTGTHYRKPDGTLVLHVEFSMADMVRVPLDQHDFAMLNEPSKGVADWLLDAELIARRLEELDMANAATEPTP